jgi:Ser/Thr protein kinase RdoA (MazF antagonist)
MNPSMFSRIADEYHWTVDASLTSIGSGLINETWKIDDGSNTYILQKMNQHVFLIPEAIDSNLCVLKEYLNTHQPEYFLPFPIITREGLSLVKTDCGYYRAFKYVNESITHDVLVSPDMAYEAAKQFGLFTAKLSGFNISRLKSTIPDFHNLPLRYRLFSEACKNGNKERIQKASATIRCLLEKENIVKKYEAFVSHREAMIRVTHHDTKISNVLFNHSGKAICVIDLDTVMPGYYTSDIGDMLRTYVCPVSEEESDLSKISIRNDFIQAIKEGYFYSMDHFLSSFEKEHFLDSGLFMIYMQALRFMTDYLENDRYYGAKYPEHNFNRARNQLTLLDMLIADSCV